MRKSHTLFSSLLTVIGMLAISLPAAAHYNMHSDNNFSVLDIRQGATGGPMHGVYLFRGQTLQSPNCGFHFDMQALDGNLVLYGGADNKTPYWNAGTQNRNAFSAVFQDDGNIVVYTPSEVSALWNSRTAGSGGVTLEMQNDGNLVEYTDSRAYPWKTNTAFKPPYTGACPQSSEATYIMWHTLISGTAINGAFTTGLTDCANRCVQTKNATQTCVAFTWNTNTSSCQLLADDFGDSYDPYGAGYLVFGGYIRGRKALGQ